MFDDNAATGAAYEAAPESTDTGGLFPNTPPPDKPIPVPQAHRGRITGVTAETGKDNGGRYLQFTWKSLETAQDDNLSVFPPQEYIDNPLVDPATLSTVAPVLNRNDGSGTFEGDSPRVKYAKTVRNSKGDGTIESIVALAISQGHTSGGISTPRTFDEVAAYLNALVVGTDVIALMRAKGGDGDFADRLRTVRFGDPANIDSPKHFKNYRKLWAE
jgi:hypothetical protein